MSPISDEGNRRPAGVTDVFIGSLGGEFCPTPTHAFAREDAPNFSHQEFTFKKGVCLTDAQKRETGVSSRRDAAQGIADLATASCDKKREALIKWQHYNHRRQDAPRMAELFQPGDEDDGDSLWGVIREDRSRQTPHWSAKQFNLKKRHHTTHIHKSPVNADNVDLQPAMHSSYQEPQLVQKPRDGNSHVKNSHAHFSCAKRRHALEVPHDETQFRCTHMPAPSAPAQYFRSPEPAHLGTCLLPEGPSFTARHMPDHFIKNVEFDDHPYDNHHHHRKKGQSSERGANRSPSPNRSSNCVARRPTSPSANPGMYDGAASRGKEQRTQDARRMSGNCVFDGTRKIPVNKLVVSNDCRNRPASARASSSGASARFGRTLSRERPQPSPSPEPFEVFHNHPGKPPDITFRAPQDGYVYKSHSQIAYDKMLCQTAVKHSPRWEHGTELCSLRVGRRSHDQEGRRCKSYDQLPKTSRRRGVSSEAMPRRTSGSPSRSGRA